MNTMSIEYFFECYSSKSLDYYVKKMDNFLAEYDKKINRSSTVRNDEVAVLSVFMNMYKPKLIIETGTNEGLSTATFALNSDAHIITYDIPHMKSNPDRMVDDDTWGKAFKNTRLTSQIEMRAKSTFEITEEELPKADLWFIDSGHSWKYVEHETNLALANMKDGGVIIWHDAHKDLPWGSDVNKFLQKSIPDAILINTNTGIAYYEY